MQLSATAVRLLALASLPGGVLLVLAWSIPAGFLLPNMFATDVRTVAGPTNDFALRDVCSAHSFTRAEDPK